MYTMTQGVARFALIGIQSTIVRSKYGRSSRRLSLQFSGVAPVTRRSGKSRQVHRRWARPKFLHQSFVEFAALSLPHGGWARALYLQLRARGHRHWAAFRVIAFRGVRILFRCWQDRVPYKESKYLESLQRRNPRLWEASQQLPPRKTAASSKPLVEKTVKAL